MNVLAWHFHSIELGMVEVDEIATALIQGLESRSCIKTPLVAIPPVLQSSNVLPQLRRVVHEVLLDSILLDQLAAH